MLYIFNSSEELLTVLSNYSSESPFYWNDVHHEKLSGENTFSFSVPSDNESAQYITEGNLVAWQDLDGYWQMFEIVHKIDTHGNGIIRNVECEHVAYELLDELLTEFTSGSTTSETIITPTKIDATDALTMLLEDTRWEVGTVSVSGTHSFAYEYDNAYSLLQKIASQWQGELQYRLVINNGVFAHKYVDLLEQRGKDIGKQFVYGKDVHNIERDIDLSSVCTALYGRGKDNLSVLVTDSVALSLWGRAGGTRHRYGLYQNTVQEDEELLQQETFDDLQKRKIPVATYTLNVTTLETISGYEDEKTRIGDTVRCIDKKFNPPILISLRVVEMNRSLSSPEKTTVVLGTYKQTIIDDLTKQKKQIDDATTVTDEVKNGVLTAEIIKIGTTNGSGTSQIDTRGDGFRVQAHIPGNYHNWSDDGTLTNYVGDIAMWYVNPDGTTNLNGGTPFTTLAINFLANNTGFTLIRDNVAETWTWHKDTSGRITSLLTSTNRTVNITYP